MISRLMLALIVLAGAVDAAYAVDPRYPDWPCVQAKVPEISLSAVWTGPPLDEASGKWKDNARISALVARLAARRTPMDEAEKLVTDFLKDAGADKTATGTLIFAGLFDTLNAERGSVLKGLERVTRKQRAAADQIRADTLALQALQGATPPDAGKIEQLGNQLVWQTRIFDDRRRVVSFVCEVPVAIDRRLFALARVIQQEME